MPNFESLPTWIGEAADGWRLSSQTDPDDDPQPARHSTEITLNIDGRAVLFSRHVAQRVAVSVGWAD